MFIDAKPEVRTALLGNGALVTALGGQNVFSMMAPNGSAYPYITLQEVGNEGIDYADDSPTRANIRIQVDVWMDGNFSTIVSLIDDTLTPLGYVRYFSTDGFESPTLVLHKILRYWVAKELS